MVEIAEDMAAMRVGLFVVWVGAVLAGCAGGTVPEGQGMDAARLTQVQEQLVVRVISGMGEDGAMVELTYKGAKPLSGLVLGLETERGAKVRAEVGTVASGQTFDATFERAGSGIGGGGKVHLSVEAVK